MEQQIVVLIPVAGTFVYYPSTKGQTLDWVGPMFVVPIQFLSSVEHKETSGVVYMKFACTKEST